MKYRPLHKISLSHYYGMNKVFSHGKSSHAVDGKQCLSDQLINRVMSLKIILISSLAVALLVTS